MPLFESSQLLVSYLICQTALKDFKIHENDFKSLKGKDKLIIKECVPLLNTPAANYIVDQLVEFTFETVDPELAEKLFKFAQKRKDTIPKGLYYDILAVHSFLNMQFKDFIKYETKALENGSKNLRLIVYTAFVAQLSKDVKTFYLAVNRLYQLGKPIKPFTDRFFYTQPFPLNGETLKVGKKLLELQPEAGYFVAYSLMLENLGKFQEEEQVLKETLKRFPNSDVVKKALIRFYVKQGKRKEAEKFVTSPELEKFYYSQLLESLDNFKSSKELKEFLAKVVKKYPDDYPLLLHVLGIYAAANYLEGINTLERTLLNRNEEINEDKAKFLFLLLVTKYTLTGNWQPEEKILINRLCSKYSYFDKIKLLKVLLDITEGKKEKAKQLLQEINPQELLYSAPVYKALLTYFGLKPLKETFPKDNPIAGETYLKTLYWLDKNLYRKAVENLQNGAKNGDECLNYTSIAWLFGDLKLSLELSKNCLQKFPNNSSVLNSVGYIMLLVDPKRYLQEAKDLIRKALKSNPQNANAYDSLGWAYYYEGNLREALKWVKKALKNKPNNVVANYHMAEILYRLNKPCEALQYLNRAFTEKENLYEEPEPGIYLKMEKLKKELENSCRR